MQLFLLCLISKEIPHYMEISCTMSNCCLPRAEKLSEVHIGLLYKLASLEEEGEMAKERKHVIVHIILLPKQQSQGQV